MATDRAYLECREPDGRKVMYRTETVLTSPDLQKQCTQKSALKRILASRKANEEEASEKRRPTGAITFGLISKIGLFVLPSLAVFGLRAMMAGKKSNREQN
jgi:hypothetical protein